MNKKTIFSLTLAATLLCGASLFTSVSLFFLQDKTYVVSINFWLNVLRTKQIFGLNVL